MLNPLYSISRSRCNKKRSGLIKTSGIRILVLGLTLLTCSSDSDRGGRYYYISGNCKSGRIDIKRVKGFGDKYYLIEIFKDKSTGKGKEFLGVVEERRLVIYKGTKLYGDNLKTAGTIIFEGDVITVSSDGKNCTYRRR